MTDRIVQQLINEVDDYLDVSAVGLYEFIWILRSEREAETLERLRELAGQGLRTLLDEQRGRLVLLTWPGKDPIGELDREVVPDDFDDPGEGVPYVAISRD